MPPILEQRRERAERLLEVSTSAEQMSVMNAFQDAADVITGTVDERRETLKEARV